MNPMTGLNRDIVEKLEALWDILTGLSFAIQGGFALEN